MLSKFKNALLMYRSALRAPSCCLSSFYRQFCQVHFRHLANAGPVPVVNSDQHAIETLEPWQENVAISLARNPKDAKDVIVDDLDATLEAHRSSNRAAVIRRVGYTVINTKRLRERPFYLEQGSDGDSAAKKVHEEIQEEKDGTLMPMWPLDSVQAKALYGEKCKTYYKKGDALEYNGAVIWCQGHWNQRRSFQDTHDTPMKRPWLAYMRTTGGDNLERFVLGSRQGLF